MNEEKKYTPALRDITKAKLNISNVVIESPLAENINLSTTYNASVFLKREDLQVVHSYKIRGAYNKISSLSAEQREQGIVCASAGNHAQGVAYSCAILKISGRIYMPSTTPKQKVEKVRMFGKGYVEIILTGDTFDEASQAAQIDCEKNNKSYIHPFDDPLIIEGQGTVGVEILQQAKESIDYIFIPIGGGGLSAGVGSYFKQLSPSTKIIGVEPAGAACMKTSIQKGVNTKLDTIDKFVDGAAVQRAGDLTFEICKDVLDDIITVPEGRVCTHILKRYNEDALVIEPAGVLSIAALDFYKEQIKGKNVVCIISGSNNDIVRTEEIRERSLLYEGLIHYFIIQFPQRSGALKDFLDNVLSETDDIAHFEYHKKTFRERGPVTIGIEVQKREDFTGLTKRMDDWGLAYQYLNDKPSLFQFLI